jgi:hypothetical protein
MSALKMEAAGSFKMLKPSGKLVTNEMKDINISKMYVL